MARARHKVVLEGYYKALAKADTIEKFVKAMAAAALYSEGQRILAASKTLVPKDTGELLASAYIEPPMVWPRGASVELGFAHPSAVSTHFNPRSGKTGGVGPGPRWENYRSWATTGQWMYLQEPAAAMSQTSEQRMGEEMSQRLRAFVSGLPR